MKPTILILLTAAAFALPSCATAEEREVRAAVARASSMPDGCYLYTSSRGYLILDVNGGVVRSFQF